MPSEQEIQYHRTFLKLWICERIWEDTAQLKNQPDRLRYILQKKSESGPEMKYHVHSCPKHPSAPPGTDRNDPPYDAYLTQNGNDFTPLKIIRKNGQDFSSVATEWELKNSVLCVKRNHSRRGKVTPVVNSSMEVTGHYARVDARQVIHPKGVLFNDISDYLANEVPVFLWGAMVYKPASDNWNPPADLPPGWEAFSDSKYNGGIEVLLRPDGGVLGAKGHRFASNNGHAISVLSPLDFFAPGSRFVAGAIRALTNRVGMTVWAGFRLLRGPSKELAEWSAARVATKTLQGMAVSSGRLLPAHVHHFGRRTLIAAEDMAASRTALAHSHTVSGFYDVAIHGNSLSFRLLEKTLPNGKRVFRDVSVRDVANAVRPHLAPGDKIRLFSCSVGATGGPAQELANELQRTVWAATTAVPKTPTVTAGVIRTAFVPKGGGKFNEFVPQRGAATLAGKGGKVTVNEVQGTIRPAPKK